MLDTGKYKSEQAIAPAKDEVTSLQTNIQNVRFSVLSVIIGVLCKGRHRFHRDVSPPLSLAWITVITSYFVLLFILLFLHNLAYTTARMILLESKSDHITPLHETLQSLQHTFSQGPQWFGSSSPLLHHLLCSLPHSPHSSLACLHAFPLVHHVYSEIAVSVLSSANIPPPDGWIQKIDVLAQTEKVNLPFLYLFLLFRPS